MKTFDELWQYITKQRPGVITVQERSELEHVFNLMRDCDCSKYLEIGTAEGNSLYVLSHATKIAHYIDLGEPHTKKPRDEIISKMPLVPNGIFSDSTSPKVRGHLWNNYDCILIDGGHDFATVLSDAILYAPLATKYIFFHDIQLPDVRAAVEWWHKRWQLGKYTEFINSPNFGYAIIEVKK